MDYKVIDRIGEYRFVHGLEHSEKTTISEGIHLPTGVKVRMKTVRGQNMADFERCQDLAREATILARLSHPNILHVYHLLKHADLRILVTEWVDGIPLNNFIRLFYNRALPESLARHYCRQMVSAIIALQRKRILLREIPLSSILIAENFRIVKLTDFSSALYLPLRKDVTNASCSPEIAAPELIQEKIDNVGPEAVSWALGIVLYFMLVGELPFTSPYYDHKRRERLTRLALRGLTSSHVAAISNFTPACQLLLRQLLEPRAIIRIPICELSTNAWITDSGSQPFQPFSRCSAHFVNSLKTISKITPSTSYKSSNGRDQSMLEASVVVPREGFIARVKNLFIHGRAANRKAANADTEAQRDDGETANANGANEWLLENEAEANSRSVSTTSSFIFGDEKCADITEAVEYLARVKKVSSSDIARAILDRPVGDISAMFQILLNIRRQNAGIYLLDHTSPDWPKLESSSFLVHMDCSMLKKMKINPDECLGNAELEKSSEALQAIHWWWCPVILKNLGGCCCSGQGEVFVGSRLDRKAFRRALMVSIDLFERKMLDKNSPQTRIENAPSLVSCKTVDCRGPKHMKSKHSINAFGVVVLRKTNQLQTPEDSNRLRREFTRRLHNSSMRVASRTHLTSQ